MSWQTLMHGLVCLLSRLTSQILPWEMVESARFCWAVTTRELTCDVMVVAGTQLFFISSVIVRKKVFNPSLVINYDVDAVYCLVRPVAQHCHAAATLFLLQRKTASNVNMAWRHGQTYWRQSTELNMVRSIFHNKNKSRGCRLKWLAQLFHAISPAKISSK